MNEFLAELRSADAICVSYLDGEFLTELDEGWRPLLSAEFENAAWKLPSVTLPPAVSEAIVLEMFDAEAHSAYYTLGGLNSPIGLRGMSGCYNIDEVASSFCDHECSEPVKVTLSMRE